MEKKKILEIFNSQEIENFMISIMNGTERDNPVYQEIMKKET